VGQRISFLAQLSVVLREIVDTVLLAERSATQHEDPGHDEQLDEAVFPLQRARHETRSISAAMRGRVATGTRRSRRRHWVREKVERCWARRRGVCRVEVELRFWRNLGGFGTSSLGDGMKAKGI
jgi:hypothetical protein